MDKPFLSVSEVASRLCVSVKTAYNLVNSGQIPHVRIGGSIKVRSEDLARYLATNYHPGTAGSAPATAEQSPGQNSPGDGGEGEATVPFPPSAP